MGMGMGIAGFQRFVPGFQNKKFHRNASRLVSRAFIVQSGEPQSLRGRKAHRVYRKLVGRLFAPSVTASSFNPRFGRCLGTLNPHSHSTGRPVAMREFYSKTERR